MDTATPPPPIPPNYGVSSIVLKTILFNEFEEEKREEEKSKKIKLEKKTKYLKTTNTQAQQRRLID